MAHVLTSFMISAATVVCQVWSAGWNATLPHLRMHMSFVQVTLACQQQAGRACSCLAVTYC